VSPRGWGADAGIAPRRGANGILPDRAVAVVGKDTAPEARGPASLEATGQPRGGLLARLEPRLPIDAHDLLLDGECGAPPRIACLDGGRVFEAVTSLRASMPRSSRDALESPPGLVIADQPRPAAARRREPRCWRPWLPAPPGRLSSFQKRRIRTGASRLIPLGVP